MNMSSHKDGILFMPQDEARHRAYVLNQLIDEAESDFKLNFGELTEDIALCGRIVSMDETSTDRMSFESVGLQCSLRRGDGACVLLDFSVFKGSLSLFPGQLIACIGHASDGCIKVKKIIERSLPVKEASSLPSGLRIGVACGPFLKRSVNGVKTINFDNIGRLILTMISSTVDVVFLIGPFVQERSTSLQVTYDECFAALMEIIQAHMLPKTHVFIVPSIEDAAHQLPVFPQPPFPQFSHLNNIHMLPNPCVLTLKTKDKNLLRVGVTSVDVIKNISAEEINRNMSSTHSDRISRLIEHLNKQRCFYPIYPPQISVDYNYWTNTILTQSDILLLPSDLKHFCRNINGCTTFNPGRFLRRDKPEIFSIITVNKAGISAKVLKVED
ncbi:hypothetical protein ACOME3_000757 [Neoechinorhynchus agilis]